MKNKLLVYEQHGRGDEVEGITLFKIQHGYLLQVNTRSKYPEYCLSGGCDSKGNQSSGMIIYTGNDGGELYSGSEYVGLRGKWERFEIGTKNGPSLVFVDPCFCKSQGVAESYKPRHPKKKV